MSRVALITGGAKRVGRAIVERLAAASFDIAFTYHHSAPEADDLVKSLSAAGRRVLGISADLSHPAEACLRIATEFAREFDRLDLLVNSASIYQPSSLQSFMPQQMQDLFAVHVEAPLLLCRHLESILRKSRGHIVNMVDLLAERPWPQYLVYSASKAALANLTLGLARALAPQITVNGIAPGVVEWPEDYPQSEREKYLKRVPLARAGTPEDVAELVHFLCTTGTYITGQIIRLDGGRSIT